MLRLRSLSCFLIVLCAATTLIAYPTDVCAQAQTPFKTRYCDIYYSDKECLNNFFWRISGGRFDLLVDNDVASSKVDRLMDRVQDILDMHPAGLHVRINLFPKYERGMVASYNSNTNSIKVYADKVTDGVLAHELAHAVVCNYFDTPPPPKMQEILTQYVDKHLWEDY